MEKMDTLNSLYKNLNALYKGTFRLCQKCKDPCCYGYVWLLKEEADRLYKKGVAVVEINQRISFIHSFPSRNGQILLNQVKPPCLLNKKGRCSIYKDRPLVCCFYPIDIRKAGDTFYLISHKECLITNEPRFLDKIVSLIYDVEPGLLKRILNTFESVNELSDYPLGKEPKSDYLKLLKIRINKGGELRMSKCKAVLDSKKIKAIRIRSKKN